MLSQPGQSRRTEYYSASAVERTSATYSDARYFVFGGFVCYKGGEVFENFRGSEPGGRELFFIDNFDSVRQFAERRGALSAAYVQTYAVH